MGSETVLPMKHILSLCVCTCICTHIYTVIVSMNNTDIASHQFKSETERNEGK